MADGIDLTASATRLREALLARRFSATEPIAAPNFEALASAHGRLVDALAADIAGALP